MTGWPWGYNHRVKTSNARLAACVLQRPHVAPISQTKINRPKCICKDGCHITEEGLAKFGYGVRQSVIHARLLTVVNSTLPG